MTDHRRRFADFIDTERRLLEAFAARARTLDHNTNRGSDFERIMSRWLRERVEPEFTASAGEVVDSFRTNANIDSRQHDVIVHHNTRHARTFTFEGGVRLVPIESVAAIVEVKLSVDRPAFDTSDAALSITNNLRLAVGGREVLSGAGGGTIERVTSAPEDGVAVADTPGRIANILFAFEGPSETATLIDWLQSAKQFDAICCLNSGCVVRRPRSSSTISVAERDSALGAFLAIVQGAARNFEN